MDNQILTILYSAEKIISFINHGLLKIYLIIKDFIKTFSSETIWKTNFSFINPFKQRYNFSVALMKYFIFIKQRNTEMKY